MNMDIPLYFYQAYRDLDRLSPGSEDTTLKAIEKIDININDKLYVLDIACGVGTSTIQLAKYFKNAEIESFDLFKHYIKLLDEKITENALEDRVFSGVGDMKNPDFANEEFDIIFCEASVEIMGFKKALDEWRRLLRSDGYAVISDISWISKPSRESIQFWKNIYGEIDTIQNKIGQIESAGYEFVDYVIVPKCDWEDYYQKLEKNLNSLSSDKSAKDFVKQLKKEINHYRTHSDDYSYVFYVMKKC